MATIILLLAPINFAAAQTKITIGVPPVPEFVLPMIAIENGYFRDHGLDVTITDHPGRPIDARRPSVRLAADCSVRPLP